MSLLLHLTKCFLHEKQKEIKIILAEEVAEAGRLSSFIQKGMGNSALSI